MLNLLLLNTNIKPAMMKVTMFSFCSYCFRKVI